MVVLATEKKSPQFGIYKAVCCDYEIVATEGAGFPDCPEHKRRTEWELVAVIDGGRSKKKTDSEAA